MQVRQCSCQMMPSLLVGPLLTTPRLPLTWSWKLPSPMAVRVTQTTPAMSLALSLSQAAAVVPGAIHKRSHGIDGSVLARRIVDMVLPESKVRRQEGNALRLTGTVHSSHKQLSFAGQEGQEDPSGHGEEVAKVSDSQPASWPGVSAARAANQAEGGPSMERPPPSSGR